MILQGRVFPLLISSRPKKAIEMGDSSPSATTPAIKEASFTAGTIHVLALQSSIAMALIGYNIPDRTNHKILNLRQDSLTASEKVLNIG